MGDLAIFYNHANELWRWLHVLFGIVWIGMLYYFNFVQTEYFKETDATVKSDVLQKLAPRALWWFRWGAMFTFLTGVILLILLILPGFDLTVLKGYIVFGAILGTLMFLNVWLIIWPNQQIVIENARHVAQGNDPLPTAATALARAGCASRHNTLFSIPMLLFMVSSAHMAGSGAYSFTDNVLSMIVGLVIIAALELNAIFGKVDYIKITTVNGVIHGGIILTIVLYLVADLL